jgi:hypothetical protein
LSDTGEKLGVQWETYQLFIVFKKAYDSVWREVLCNIKIEFGTGLKLVTLNKMCLKKTHTEVQKGKTLI